MAKVKLTPEAQAFVRYGNVTYKNGPWDHEDIYPMELHGNIMHSLLTGELQHPPVCKSCRKVIVPTGSGWMHMGTPRTQVQTTSEHPLAKIKGGANHQDMADPSPSSHEATPADIGTPPSSILSKQFN